MSTRSRLNDSKWQRLPALAMFAWTALASAQTTVDSAGNLVGEYPAESSSPSIGNEYIPLLTASDLQELVGPIALYPDDLLAIVLPASTFPLQIVQASRFLAELQSDPSLQPDEAWDDAVVALVNYPEVVALLNDDLDWTWRLGEAVVAQQADVIAAVEYFRDRAYAAGNLKSDAHQVVSDYDGVIEITPASEDIIYVPYYEPEHVVVYQPRPVYYYYPQPYPVYNYPYPSGYAFNNSFFWGVTTAFSVGWYTDSLHVFHHSYYGHPYFGRPYWNQWWYRRPTIHVHNSIYVNNRQRHSPNHYRSGDNWRPQNRRALRSTDQRVTRTRFYPSDSVATLPDTAAAGLSSSRTAASRNARELRETAREQTQSGIRFRPRSADTTNMNSGEIAAAARLSQSRGPAPDRNRSSARFTRVDAPNVRESQPLRTSRNEAYLPRSQPTRVPAAQPARIEAKSLQSRRPEAMNARRSDVSPKPLTQTRARESESMQRAERQSEALHAHRSEVSQKPARQTEARESQSKPRSERRSATTNVARNERSGNPRAQRRR